MVSTFSRYPLFAAGGRTCCCRSLWRRKLQGILRAGLPPDWLRCQRSALELAGADQGAFDEGRRLVRDLRTPKMVVNGVFRHPVTALRLLVLLSTASP